MAFEAQIGGEAPLADLVAAAMTPDAVCEHNARARCLAQLCGTTPAPLTVGRYELRAPLGSGGGGSIYRAFDPQLARAVAVKLIPASGDDALPPEPQLLARVEHPHVIPVHDCGAFDWSGAADGAPPKRGIYVVMNLAEGDTLTGWIERQASGTSERVRLLREACAGLRAAHALGIVHRDFKPSNVLVDRSGRAMISDFGVAELAAGGATPRPAHASGPLEHDDVTLPFGFGGTPVYMAPEQLAGECADARADVYAFALTCVEVLSGREQCRGLDRTALMAAKLRVPELDRVPRRLRRALRRALEPDVRRRASTLEDLACALERSAGARRRSLAWTIAGASAVAAAAVAVAVSTPGPAPLHVPPAPEFREAVLAVAPPHPEATAAHLWSRYQRAAGRWVEARKRVPAWPWRGRATTACLEDAGRRLDEWVRDAMSAASPDELSHAAVALPEAGGPSSCATPPTRSPADADNDVLMAAASGALQRGALGQGRELLATLAARPRLSPRVASRLALLQAELARAEGRHRAALILLDQAGHPLDDPATHERWVELRAEVLGIDLGAARQALAFLGESPDAELEHPRLRGRLHASSGACEQAIAILEPAVSVAFAEGGWQELARTHLALSEAYACANDGPRADRSADLAVAVAAHAADIGPALAADAHLVLAILHLREGAQEPTEQRLRAAESALAGVDAPIRRARILRLRGALDLLHGEVPLASANAHYDAALDLLAAAGITDRSADAGRIHTDRGLAAAQRNQFDVALASYDRADAILGAALGSAHADLVRLQHNRAGALLASGDLNTALAVQRAAVDMLEQIGVGTMPEAATVLCRLGDVERELRLAGSGVEAIERGLALAAASLDIHNPRAHACRISLARALGRAERFAEAADAFEQVLADLDAENASDKRRANAHYNLAKARWQAGDRFEATAAARHALALHPAPPGSKPRPLRWLTEDRYRARAAF